MKIEFTNIHGNFSLEIGERYDFDLLDLKGDVTPLSNVKVVSETDERVLFEDEDGFRFPLPKETIVHETKVED